MNYSEAITQLSKELDLPYRVVDQAYKSFWVFVRDKIQDLPFKEDISEDEFNKLRTNFNIPSLGKLSCTYDRMQRVKERYKYIKKLREKND